MNLNIFSIESVYKFNIVDELHKITYLQLDR